jgi:hypothetical protein
VDIVNIYTYETNLKEKGKEISGLKVYSSSEETPCS